MKTRLEELDNQIYSIYRKAYDDNPSNTLVRLNPDLGVLGELWKEWDTLMEKEA